MLQTVRAFHYGYPTNMGPSTPFVYSKCEDVILQPLNAGMEPPCQKRGKSFLPDCCYFSYQTLYPSVALLLSSHLSAVFPFSPFHTHASSFCPCQSASPGISFHLLTHHLICPLAHYLFKVSKSLSWSWERVF